MFIFLLTIVFGWAGVYRFHKRHYVRAILYLLTFGIFGVGWLVDVICALVDMVDGWRKPASDFVARVAPPPPPATDADKLRQYKRLLDEGAITREEYERKKGELLDPDDPARRYVACPYCGTRNRRENVHCSACGAKLE